MYAQIFLLTILSPSQCLEFSAASKTICRCLWTQKLQTRCNKKLLIFKSFDSRSNIHGNTRKTSRKYLNSVGKYLFIMLSVWQINWIGQLTVRPIQNYIRDTSIFVKCFIQKPPSSQHGNKTNKKSFLSDSRNCFHK